MQKTIAIDSSAIKLLSAVQQETQELFGAPTFVYLISGGSNCELRTSKHLNLPEGWVVERMDFRQEYLQSMEGWEQYFQVYFFEDPARPMSMTERQWIDDNN